MQQEQVAGSIHIRRVIEELEKKFEQVIHDTHKNMTRAQVIVLIVRGMMKMDDEESVILFAGILCCANTVRNILVR